jgi:hypothetical protein
VLPESQDWFLSDLQVLHFDMVMVNMGRKRAVRGIWCQGDEFEKDNRTPVAWRWSYSVARLSHCI